MPSSKASDKNAITPPLMKALWATARECGVSDEALHDAAFIGCGKTSLRQLTQTEASKLIDGMRVAAGLPLRTVSKPRRWAQGNHGRRDTAAKAEYLINERERRMLAEAAELRGWSDETLANFIQRQLGTREVRTMAEFNKVFWPLKSMNRRDNKHA